MLFFIILIMSLICGFLIPWWAVAIIGFLAALYAGKTSAQSFWSGFLAVFIVWTVLALFKSVPNNHILAKRVAQLFTLPHWTLLLLISALIGGLLGGMSALSGLKVKKLFEKRKVVA